MCLEFFYGDGLADDRVRMELYTKGAQTVYLFIDDGVRQTELRNTIFEYTADLVQGFEDMYFVAVFGGVSGEGKTGRTGTDNGDLTLRLSRV